MKILYAIQGTGNGHLSRARDVIPILQKKGDLDILISGVQADVQLPYEIKYKFRGLSFIFGKKGGIDLWETYKKANLRNLFEEINLLPIHEYDLVINDFEPVSAWACYMKNKDCFGLSHQAAVLHKKAPKPEGIDLIGRSIMKNYAPVSSKYGFHFLAYDTRTFTPVVRQEVRNLVNENKGHYTVYLPAYSDERIIKMLTECDNVKWQVFSKHAGTNYREHNVSIFPIANEQFLLSMGTAEGVLCGAGFETPAEALFLGKKLMVIPMKHQIEQQCNAVSLRELGVPVIKSLKQDAIAKIRDWVASGPVITIKYPDQTEQIIEQLIEDFFSRSCSFILPGKKAYTVRELRKLSLRKILLQLAG
jgi:uncharacterized protein (TIGR00661 family)